MENASKALLMAGTILISMLIVTLGVYLASSFSQTSETYYRRWSTEEVERYNSEITKNFIIENGKTYITAQGIVTLRNLLQTSKYSGTTQLLGVRNSLDNSTILQDYSFEVTGTAIKIKKYEVTISETSREGLITKINVSGP